MAPKKKPSEPAAKKQKLTEETSGSYWVQDFSNRSIKVERYVKLNELTETPVPTIVKNLKWEGFVQQNGRANVNIVREFYGGINPPTIDDNNLTLEAKVRGVKVTLSADVIASTLGINRPTAEQFQFPYLTAEALPEMDEIVKDLYVDEMVNQKRWQVKFLTASKAVLNLILKANLDPRGTRASFNDDYAKLLYETGQGTAIDVGKIIWQVVVSVYKSEDSPSLPYGLLLTKICSTAGVKRRVNDEFMNQMEPVGRMSMTRTQSQSSKSRNAVTMETVLDRLDAMAVRLDTMSAQMGDMMKMIQLLVKDNEKLKKYSKAKEAHKVNVGDGEDDDGDEEDDADDGKDEAGEGHGDDDHGEEEDDAGDEEEEEDAGKDGDGEDDDGDDEDEGEDDDSGED